MADPNSLQNIFGDAGSSTPTKPKVSKRSSRLENIFGTAPVKAGPPETPYFAAVDKKGSYGFSDKEKDVSGRPFFAYRKPGDTATTTDKTRVATKFDPRTPSKQTKESFYNPRATGLREEMKNEFGLSYSDELDHKIALAVSGSNARENLRKVAADDNDDGQKAAELALGVADGRRSLFDAQVEFAKFKGLETPFVGVEEEKEPGFLKKLLQSAGKEIKEKAGKVRDIFKPKEVGAAVEAPQTSRVSNLQNIFGDQPKPVPGPGAVIADMTATPSIQTKETTPTTATRGTDDDIKTIARATASFFNPKSDFNISKVAKEIPGSFSKVVGQPQIRAYGAVGSYIAKKLGLSTQDLKPEGQFLTDLYGTDKPINLTKIGRETRGTDPESESEGVFKRIDPAIGFLVGSLDAVDGGVLGRLSSVLKLSKSAREIIAASKNADEISRALKNEIPTLTDGLSRALAEPLVYINNVNDVDKILNRTKFELQELNKAKAGATKPPPLPGITGETAAVATKPPVFEGFKDITTDTLDQLKGRSTVSKQFISDLTNRPELKQAERDAVRAVLETYQVTTIPVREFAEKVKAELLPLKRKSTLEADLVTRYEGISLPKEQRGPVTNYSENIYNSSVKTSAGDIHFNTLDSSMQGGYFGHTRVEDVPGGTRRVIEVQSDLYQKGRLENELSNMSDADYKKFSPEERLKRSEARIKSLRQYNDPTAHFRMVREEVKQAAKDKKTKLQFPTGETAMKIEGLGENTSWYLQPDVSRADELKMSPDQLSQTFDKGLTTGELKIGQKIRMGEDYQNPHSQWIITDVLGDGKFKAVPAFKSTNAGSALKYTELSGAEKTNYEMQLKEQFDISGKVDTNNPIYRFYEKTLGRYLSNKYGAKQITDAQGVTWYEVSVPKGAGDEPVSAFKKGTQYYPLFRGPKVAIDQVAELLKDIVPSDKIKFVFNPNLIKEDGALGAFRINERLQSLNPKYRPVIELYEKSGKTYTKVVFHEAYHYLEEKVFSKEFVAKLNKETLAKMNAGDHDFYKEYKTPEARAAEYRADQFAKEQLSKTGYKSPITKVLDMLRGALKKISDLATRIKKHYDSLPGKKGGYARFFDEEGEFRADFRETEKANKELNKLLQKEKPPVTLPIDKQINELQQQRIALEEALQNNPAREVAKYANKNGELPEVLGEGGKFAKSGDEFANDLGYESSEDLRLAYSNYRLLQKRLESIKSDLSDARAKRADVAKEDKEAKSLGHLLEKTAKKTDAEIAKQQHMERIIKAEQESALKVADEEKYHQSYLEKIKQEKKNASKPTGLYAKIRAVLNPVKSVDKKTQGILTNWFEKKIVAKQIAQEEFLKYRDAGVQNFKEVLDYQAGKPTQYIRNALDSMGTEFKRRGLDFDFRDNYLPQVWDNPPKDANRAINKYLKDKGMSDAEIQAYMNGEPISEQKALRLKVRPNFVKDRFWPDYKTGMKYGLKPKYRTPAQLIAYYREAGETAIANRELVEELKREAKLLPSEDAPDSWKPITLRFSREGLYASPKLADLINGKFRDEANLSVYQTIAKGGSNLSKFMQEMVLSAGIPYSTVNFFAIGAQLIKNLTTGIGEVATGQIGPAITSLKTAFAVLRANSNVLSGRFFYNNRDIIMRMARQNIDVSQNIASYEALYKKFSDAFPSEPGVINKLKGIKNAIGVEFGRAFNKKTFSSMMPQVVIQLFKDTFTRAIKQGMTEMEAEKFAAQVTKAYNGITGDIGRSETTQETLATLLFAPRFRESLINVFVNAGKGWSTEFKNKAFSKSRALITGMVITYGLYNLLNKKLNDEYMWENPPGKEFSLRVPLKNAAGDSVYIDFMPSLLAMPRAVGVGALALARGDFSTFGQKVGSFFSMPIKIFSELASNQDYFGQPIYKETDTTTEKIKKGAIHVGVAVNHPFIRETYKYWAEEKPLYQVLAHMFELPLKFSNFEKEAAAEFYDSLDKKAKERAREVEKITPIFEKNQALIEEGKRAEADRIYNALTPKDQAVYKSIRTSQKRAATLKRKIIIEQTYNDLQKLKEEGRTEEANAIYYGLSDEDRELYDKIRDDKQG